MISHERLFTLLTSNKPLLVKMAEAWIAKMDMFEFRCFLDWLERNHG